MHREPIDPAGIEWTRVSPKYLRVRLAGWAIGSVIFLAMSSVPLILLLTGVLPHLPLLLVWLLPVVVLVLAAWRGLLLPRQVRAIGYAERNEGTRRSRHQ